MELRDYAEHVFFARTVEDKLLAPGKITDDQVGSPLLQVLEPHRPTGLEMTPVSGTRVSFPRFSELHDEHARGRALHFFANHELLALELMALALLKFPKADPKWRRTLFATMRDEQKHMGLYLQRMKEFGVELGEIPLNRFFWDQISTMEVPVDFTVRMSLTFEQANLDFSMVYRDAFEAAGDLDTAQLMQEVLDDEISHVRHGVRALQAWKPAGETLWETYEKALPYPLTPARAKGSVFCQGPREAAELPADFIDALRVYRHTRGRPPVVRLFNPATEAALGQKVEGHTPNRGILTLAQDLEMLPLLLGNTDDIVLVRNKPSTSHLARLQKLGWPQVDWVETPLDQRKIPPHHSLCKRQFSGVEPWGWDPTVAEFLEPLRPGLGEDSPPFSAHVTGHEEWSSKAWMAQQLPSLLEALPPETRERMVLEGPTVCASVEEAVVSLEHHRKAGTGRVVFKAPFGTAGRDAIRVEGSELATHEEAWIQRCLNTQGRVVAEPWYDRVLDLSFQFQVREDGGFKPLGLTRFFTDDRGQYLGSLVAPLGIGVTTDIKRFLFQGRGGSWVTTTLEALSRQLGETLAQNGFRGRAGMDAMVIRLPNGELKLRAPLELNPRATMGHIALAAAKPMGSKSICYWTLLTPPMAKRAGVLHVRELLNQWQQELPEVWEGDRPTQGIFPLNDPTTAQGVIGVLWVTKSFEDIPLFLENAS